ncbi:hypothetical protein [Falsiroseomonas sp.]|uniref:hypothetical protein n=1 Tax=Falsiroseomonas sp. TaxID=2870721 RepID=UPI003568BACC
MPLGEALRQLARTAALVAVLAALLLAVTAWVAETPGAQVLFGLVLAAPLAALAGWQVAEALRTGELPHRTGVDTRARNPAAYWTGVGALALGAAGCGALALWCVARLASQ